MVYICIINNYLSLRSGIIPSSYLAPEVWNESSPHKAQRFNNQMYYTIDNTNQYNKEDKIDPPRNVRKLRRGMQNFTILHGHNVKHVILKANHFQYLQINYLIILFLLLCLNPSYLEQLDHPFPRL